jgi:hypothetical protein
MCICFPLDVFGKKPFVAQQAYGRDPFALVGSID